MDFTEAYPDTCSTTALAARAGAIDTLKDLIRQGKAVDVKDNRGWISLHQAAHNGHAECVKLILQQEADLVDFRTFREETALMLASRFGSLSCVQHLIEAGADVNAATFEDFTPLWEATVCKSVECIKALIAAGANINSGNFSGDTPLHYACQHGQTTIVTCLLEAGADIVVKTENDLTPLFIAAQFGQLKCLELLVENAREKGPEFVRDYVNTPAYDKATPLYLAAQEGHADCLELLLQLGADPHLCVHVNPQPGDHLFPLQAAISNGNLRCVQLLLKVTDIERFGWPLYRSKERLKDDLDLDEPPSDFVQPLYLAMDHKEPDFLKLLISHGYLKQYQQSVEAGTIGNIFETVPLNIKPVVTFVKCCEKWLRKQYRDKGWSLHSSALFTTPPKLRLQLMAALLRSGAPCIDSLRRIRVLSGYEAQDVVLLCKYLKPETYCSDCTKANRSHCIDRLEIVRAEEIAKVDSTLLLKLALTPNYMKVAAKVDQCFPEWWLSPNWDDNWEERFRFGGPDRNVVGTHIHCRESFNTLQHMCRVNIVYQLLHNNNYTREATLMLELPQQLQSYLLYEESGTLGRTLVPAAKEMKDLEATVDQLFEDSDISDLQEALL